MRNFLIFFFFYYYKFIRNVLQFSYNFTNKVFFDMRLNIKYLNKYFFGISKLQIKILEDKILRENFFFLINIQVQNINIVY